MTSKITIAAACVLTLAASTGWAFAQPSVAERAVAGVQEEASHPPKRTGSRDAIGLPDHGVTARRHSATLVSAREIPRPVDRLARSVEQRHEGQPGLEGAGVQAPTPGVPPPVTGAFSGLSPLEMIVGLATAITGIALVANDDEAKSC